MTDLSPKKLLHSKWTALAPRDREKHFLVVAVEHDPLDAQRVTTITLEAVLSRRHYTLPWRALADAAHWQRGWR
ncbi:TIGR02450 family Trp-rich protein [Vogesella sp. LYT5W]|uniref:TIGR02450 family Trp-rich protein n=1 Tax=Vogesella margarita TaxID=2984199 RepID=A0ABT5IJQ6_9NEIS|nr:TIGR02450 family Trp-rich protein [Vogesella margarita]MDC7712755.1 TIGR02450 family Trp-rich protein [Vogesella margarita]